MSGDILTVNARGGGVGVGWRTLPIQWIEVRGLAKHSTMHRKYPAQNVNSVKVEKSRHRPKYYPY